jgi:hypothetical protein
MAECILSEPGGCGGGEVEGDAGAAKKQRKIRVSRRKMPAESKLHSELAFPPGINRYIRKGMAYFLFCVKERLDRPFSGTLVEVH